MLAVRGELPTDDQPWAYEFKWDGVRALVTVDGDELHVHSRGGRDVTSQYPELTDLGRSFRHTAVIDGEVVALDDRGRPSFRRLQTRLGVGGRTAAVRARTTPVVLMVFDVLHVDGHSTRDLAYRERRAILTTLAISGPAWQTPVNTEDGVAMLEASRSTGLEGVMAKRADAPYLPGRRSPSWRKVKIVTRQELVVGGWLEGEGSRRGRIGALLVGHYDLTPDEARQRGGPQSLRYAGSVGSGLGEHDLEHLGRLFAPIERDTSPFDAGEPRAGGHWVEPVVVVEVAYGEWPKDGVLRHPVFHGIRPDRESRAVVREVAR